MKMIVAGHREGRSCVIETKEWEHDPDAEDVTSSNVAILEVGAPEIRAQGRSEFRDYGIPIGTAAWNRVRFPPNQERAFHYTNTLDTITVIDGSLWLLLDDGDHELVAGDCTVLQGVDHGWRIGPDGCTTSNILFGIPVA